jgi:hypothetical protein
MPHSYKKTLEERSLKLRELMETQHGQHLKDLLMETLNDALREVRAASTEIQVAKATGAADVCFSLISAIDGGVNYAQELMRLQEEAMKAAQQEVPQEWRQQKAF